MTSPIARYSYDHCGNLTGITAASPSGPPQIIRHPVAQIVRTGDFASFSVVVADAAGVTYQWTFNGTNIPEATGDSLLLPKVSAADAGQYAVVVTNSAGSETSTSATLQLDEAH